MHSCGEIIFMGRNNQKKQGEAVLVMKVVIILYFSFGGEAPHLICHKYPSISDTAILPWAELQNRPEQGFAEQLSLFLFLIILHNSCSLVALAEHNVISRPLQCSYSEIYSSVYLYCPLRTTGHSGKKQGWDFPVLLFSFSLFKAY
jgi:hypothetical protein